MSLVKQEVRSFKVVFVYSAPTGTLFSMPAAVLSAVLKQAFENIEIDLIPIGKEIDLIPISKTNHPEKYSINWFCDQIAARRPNLVAVSCMSPHWIGLKEYLDAAKRVAPLTPILVGGYQPTLAPEETIAYPAIDFICVGDGEMPIIQLVRRLMERGNEPVTGLWEKKDELPCLPAEWGVSKWKKARPANTLNIMHSETLVKGVTHGDRKFKRASAASAPI